MHRMLKPVLMASAAAVLLAAGLGMAHAQIQAGGVDREGSWYVGEGLKPGDYFRYSMCHVDYKECVRFEMELWIRGDVQSGSETKWLAETVVYDGNRVVAGEMELGKIAPEPTGGTPELGTYRGAFKSSVVWLSAFATADVGQSGKGPKEFSATSWGKIANIGGEQVVPVALDTVRTGAGTWDAVQVGWKTGGATSRIWIVDEFPFPVKARTFTHVSEGIPPLEYEFELLGHENVPQSPFEGVQSTDSAFVDSGCDTDFEKEVTVKRPTANFHYQIHAFYGPDEPAQGCPMEWLIKFLNKYDETEFLNQVQFDLLVRDGDGGVVRSLAEEEGRQFLYSPSGQYLLDMVVREDPGEVKYTVLVYGLAPENWVPDDDRDFLEIPVTVVAGPGIAAPAQAPTEPPAQASAAIPGWIKTNAGWWADGQLDDASFVGGIQYLVGEGVISVPPTAQGEPSGAGIPGWVKTNAGWWADGQLDDASFVGGIQFLVGEGIITLP